MRIGKEETTIETAQPRMFVTDQVVCNTSRTQHSVPEVHRDNAPDPLRKAQGPWWWEVARFQARFLA
jgi:hypothetical protein